jgi:hypothetical protein
VESVVTQIGFEILLDEEIFISVIVGESPLLPDAGLSHPITERRRTNTNKTK